MTTSEPPEPRPPHPESPESSEPLWTRSLRLYFAARFTSTIAVTMLRASIVWQVFALSRSPLHLGLVGLVQFLPALGLSLVGGAIADTRDRRRVMMTSQLAPLGLGLSLALLTEVGIGGLGLLYGAVFAISVASAFEGPAGAALLPSLVARDSFPRVVAAASTIRATAFASGPALAGFVIAAAAVSTAYAASALLFLASLVMLSGVRSQGPVGESRRVDWQAMRDGLVFVWRHPIVLGCMTLDMLAVMFGGAVALLPIYATDILHVGARGYGILASALEVGAIVCSIALTLLPPIRRAGPVLLWSVAIYGVATIVFGLSRSFSLSVAAFMVVGMADQVSVVVRSTTIQLTTPDGLRGRVSSVNLVFIGASNQLGAAESGFVAAVTSPTFAVVAGGVASLVVVAMVAMVFPELRRYRLSVQGVQSR